MAAKIKSRDLTVCAVHYNEYIAKYGQWSFNPKTKWVMQQRKQKRHYETQIANGCDKHKNATIQYYSVNPTTGMVNVQKSKQKDLFGNLLNQLQIRDASNHCKSNPMSETTNTTTTTEEKNSNDESSSITTSSTNSTSTINDFFKPNNKQESDLPKENRKKTIEDYISIELCSCVVYSFLFLTLLLFVYFFQLLLTNTLYLFQLEK